MCKLCSKSCYLLLYMSTVAIKPWIRRGGEKISDFIYEINSSCHMSHCGMHKTRALQMVPMLVCQGPSFYLNFYLKGGLEDKISPKPFSLNLTLRHQETVKKN